MSDEAKPIVQPFLAKEVVATQQLGEVVVNGLRLSQRLALGRLGKAADPDAAADLFCARILAIAVTDKAGKPVFNEETWDIFAAQHQDDSNALLDVALRLGGFNRDEAKNA